jgi:glycosyltransferase involved in cell wall biosynthesis
MKVLHLSSFDTAGGAARAAYRIHQGLQNTGVNSRMLVQFKSGDDRAVVTADNKAIARLRSSLDSSLLKFHRRCDHFFSLQWVPDSIASQVAQFNPDVINLNWVCNGYLQVETLAKFNKPLVWTLQDMWAFTGGCHYSQGCEHYKEACGNCPQLKSGKDSDLSRWVWQRKAKAWKNLNLTIVAPTSWMAQCASSSSLFRGMRIEMIPFGLDIKKFRPVEQQLARELLDLPQDKKLVLFGAINATGDTRKGFHLLLPALKNLSQSGWKDQIELVVFGASQPEKPVDLGFKSHYLGRLQDDLSLRLVYCAADVMIAPSTEEAFGQTASESIACGTPVVVFNETGLKDIVDHQKNGYVANYSDIEDLARGIAWVIEDKDRHQKLCQYAREKAEQEFTLELQAQRYMSLFKQIVDK